MPFPWTAGATGINIFNTLRTIISIFIAPLRVRICSTMAVTTPRQCARAAAACFSRGTIHTLMDRNMPIVLFACPKCAAALQFAKPIRPGTMIGCPRCRNCFAAKPPGDTAPAEAVGETAAFEPTPADKPAAAVPPAPWPKIPGYEILAEVGRGGMGVVYKARQQSLNRLVALKMILAGPHTRPELAVRFARRPRRSPSCSILHIVQIHEVCEHGTCSFSRWNSSAARRWPSDWPARRSRPSPPPNWWRCWRGPSPRPTSAASFTAT